MQRLPCATLFRTPKPPSKAIISLISHAFFSDASISSNPLDVLLGVRANNVRAAGFFVPLLSRQS